MVDSPITFLLLSTWYDSKIGLHFELFLSEASFMFKSYVMGCVVVIANENQVTAWRTKNVDFMCLYYIVEIIQPRIGISSLDSWWLGLGFALDLGLIQSYNKSFYLRVKL